MTDDPFEIKSNPVRQVYGVDLTGEETKGWGGTDGEMPAVSMRRCGSSLMQGLRKVADSATQSRRKAS